jgi:hypothetical protein
MLALRFERRTSKPRRAALRRSGGQDLDGFSRLALAGGYATTGARHRHFPIDGRLGWRKPKKLSVMSGSKFWAKNQDRRPESQKAGGPLAGTLTATDRCGVRAHGVLLPSRRELLFCAHHNRQ